MNAAPPTGSRERAAVFLICVLGAFHVFVFAAAFPFFAVMDEQVHVDLVVRYAHGQIPRSFTPVSAEALPFIAIYGTPEYLWPPASQPGGKIAAPPWKLPLDRVRGQLLAREAGYQQQFKNHEAASPPLYYAMAAAWWRAGRVLGLDGGALLYWLRFLNVPLVAALACLGWRAARRIFPENPFIRVAVPALVAFLPQSVFYAANSDILAPLTFGAAFLLLLRVWEADEIPGRLALAAGLALAAAYLTKTSNLPLLAAAGIFLGLKITSLAARGDLHRSSRALIVLLAAAALPMAAWMIWCRLNFGDLTGASQKIQFLGWTQKPLAEWFQHPLFSFAGFWFFLRHNLATFWQGEMLWQRQPLAIPGVDSVYVVLSLGALALTAAAWLRRPSPFVTAQRAALGFAFLSVAAAFAFYALLSVQYDFHDCFYPSRAQPFFISGRLLLGMLIPFLLLFACGLDRMLSPFQFATKFAALLALLLFMMVSEATINGVVFANDYNWFHL